MFVLLAPWIMGAKNAKELPRDLPRELRPAGEGRTPDEVNL